MRSDILDSLEKGRWWNISTSRTRILHVLEPPYWYKYHDSGTDQFEKKRCHVCKLHHVRIVCTKDARSLCQAQQIEDQQLLNKVKYIGLDVLPSIRSFLDPEIWNRGKASFTDSDDHVI